MKATQEQRESLVPKRMAQTKEATRGTVRPHQPGQAIFRAILPEEIEWKPFAAFPPAVRLAVVVGQPLQRSLKKLAKSLELR